MCECDRQNEWCDKAIFKKFLYSIETTIDKKFRLKLY